MRGQKKKNAVMRFLEKLHNPPNWVALIVVGTIFLVCPLIVLTVIFDYGHTVYAVTACVICGILMTYAIVVAIFSVVRVRKKVLKVADKYAFTRNLHKNYEFRTLVFGAYTFICNIGYTAFLIVMAFTYNSRWYGVMGIYYILLSISRGSILLQARKDDKKYKNNFHRRQEAKVRTYRYSAGMMVVLSLSLAFSVIELVVGGSGFRLSGWLIYIFAAVAAYKVIYGIIHFVRSSKRDDLVVRAVRYINLTTALVSVLCLQTSIVAAYPPKGMTVALLNSITGFIVCLIPLALGLYMLSFARAAKKKLLSREAALAEAVEDIDSVGYNRDGYDQESFSMAEEIAEEIADKLVEEVEENKEKN